jgi:hypothetical protein
MFRPGKVSPAYATVHHSSGSAVPGLHTAMIQPCSTVSNSGSHATGMMHGPATLLEMSRGSIQPQAPIPGDHPGQPGDPREQSLGWLGQPPMRYPNAYVWFVFVSSLDIMLTWAILARDGTEVNPLARIVIDAYGLPGAIVFKFSLMLFVILVCEVIGRQRDRSGQILAWLAVSVSSLPVAWSLVLLTAHTYWIEQVI